MFLFVDGSKVHLWKHLMLCQKRSKCHFERLGSILDRFAVFSIAHAEKQKMNLKHFII